MIEDCFYTSAPSLAATALARTERLTVGIGILPAVARNPAVTAMELATLAELAPGRLIAGIGHGVQLWMEQMGARTPSPLTTLQEVLTVVRSLLAGERLTVDGVEVTMRDVALQPPPTDAPPVLAGVHGPEIYARRASRRRRRAGRGRRTDLRPPGDRAGRADRRRRVPDLGVHRAVPDRRSHRGASPDDAVPRGSSRSRTRRSTPIHTSTRSASVDANGGDEALAAMPAEWWLELGAIGTIDDIVAHVARLHEAGAHDVAFFPGPTIELTREDLDAVAAIRTAIT